MLKTVTVAALVALVAGHAQADDYGILSAAGGRYAFGQISSYHSDVYLLDTQTGMIWQMQCFDQPAPGPGALCQDHRLVSIPFYGVSTEVLNSVLSPPAKSGKDKK